MQAERECLTKALDTPGLGEESGVLMYSMIKVYLGYHNIGEILKLLKKMDLSDYTL